MNRDIKFRTWSKNIDEHFMATQGDDDLETLQSFMFHYGDEKILMQFTGLKDKNGKEIYEEDIIQEWIEDNLHDEGGFWWYGIVRFLNGQWKVLEHDFEYKDYEDTHKLYQDFEILEVIGNSYENPELL